MKKLIAFILALVIALTLSGDFRAEEVSSFNDTSSKANNKKIEDFNDYKSKGSAVNKKSINDIKPLGQDGDVLEDGLSFKAVTKGTYKKISKKGKALTYTRTQKGSKYTHISYYKKINGKIVNYRNSIIYHEAGGYKISVYYLYSTPKKATSTCKATQVAYGCIVTKKSDRNYRVVKKLMGEFFEDNGKLEYLVKYNLSTTKANRFKDMEDALLSAEQYEYTYNSNGKIELQKYHKTDKNWGTIVYSSKLYSYHSNGKLKEIAYDKWDGQDRKIFQESKKYRSTGKIKYKEQWYIFKNGYVKRFITYDYNTKGKLIHKFDRKGNSKGYVTYRDSRKYYLSGKTKERTYAYLRAQKNDDVKTSYYYKYRTNGKKQTYKKAYINTNGTLKKMYTYTYNKKGQKKSNKYGSAYKYITYTKKNSNTIKKVTKAKYNKKGKLGKAYKVKATKLTKTFYLGFLE